MQKVYVKMASRYFYVRSARTLITDFTLMGRKGKELSPKEKRVVINIFECGTSITEIGRLLKRPHSTVSTFIRRYLLRGELENRRRSGRPKKEYAPGLQKIRKTC